MTVVAEIREAVRHEDIDTLVQAFGKAWNDAAGPKARIDIDATVEALSSGSLQVCALHRGGGDDDDDADELQAGGGALCTVLTSLVLLAINIALYTGQSYALMFLSRAAVCETNKGYLQYVVSEISSVFGGFKIPDAQKAELIRRAKIADTVVKYVQKAASHFTLSAILNDASPLRCLIGKVLSTCACDKKQLVDKKEPEKKKKPPPRRPAAPKKEKKAAPKKEKKTKKKPEH